MHPAHPSLAGTTRRTPLAHIVAVIALLAGIAAVLHYFSLRSSLWEDEIIALTHTFEPLPSFFMGVVRNDIHPFFFFLVLKAWMLFSPANGSWALASTLAFTALSAFVIFRVALKADGMQAAIWATALYLLLPSTAWAAGNLRMYGLLPAMVVGVWYLNVQFLRAPSRAKGCLLLLLQLCTAYIHAIEFIFVAFIALAVLLEHGRTAQAKVLRGWLALQVGAGILMLPLAMSALVRGTEPLPASSLSSFFTIFGQVVAGSGSIHQKMLNWIGLAIFVVLLFFAMKDKKTRVRTLVLPVGVLVVIVLIGFLGKPIFKSPIFSANLLPFLVLSAGAGIARLLDTQGKSALIGVSLFALVFAGASPFWSGTMMPKENFLPAANYLKQHVQKGDLVVVPHMSVFWATMFYSTGSDWGQPLAIRPPDNPQWSKITQKLGPKLSDALGLVPTAAYVDHQGVRYCAGSGAAQCSPDAARVWVVDRKTYNNGVDLAKPMSSVQAVYFGKELVLSLLKPAAGGSTRFDNPYLTPGAGAAPAR